MAEYKLNPEILNTPIQDGKILLLEPQNGLYFELNETSAVIYQGFLDELSDSQIIDQLTQLFDCQPQQAESDFQELTGQFLKNNIVLKV